jgi:hypothetical protein
MRTVKFRPRPALPQSSGQSSDKVTADGCEKALSAIARVLGRQAAREFWAQSRVKALREREDE